MPEEINVTNKLPDITSSTQTHWKMTVVTALEYIGLPKFQTDCLRLTKICLRK